MDARSVDGRSATGNQGGREVGKSSQVGREVGSLSLPINVIHRAALFKFDLLLNYSRVMRHDFMVI